MSETGIERHWREADELSKFEALRNYAQAMRPLTEAEMQRFRGDFMRPYRGCGMLAGALAGIYGFGGFGR